VIEQPIIPHIKKNIILLNYIFYNAPSNIGTKVDAIVHEQLIALTPMPTTLVGNS
jgi:hypothetical protein